MPKKHERLVGWVVCENGHKLFGRWLVNERGRCADSRRCPDCSSRLVGRVTDQLPEARDAR